MQDVPDEASQPLKQGHVENGKLGETKRVQPTSSPDENDTKPKAVKLNFVSAIRLMGVKGSRWRLYLSLWVVCVLLVMAYCVLSFVTAQQTASLTTLMIDYSNIQISNTTVPESEDSATLMETTKAKFFSITGELVILTIVTAGIYTLFLTVSHEMAELNRLHITEQFLKWFMFKNCFYSVSTENRELDNLDSRIVEDLRQYGYNFVNFIFGNVYYTGIFPTVFLAIGYTYLMSDTGGWAAVGISYISFIIVATTNYFLSIWTGKASYIAESSLHSLQGITGALMRNAETVAFYKGGDNEKSKIETAFKLTQKSMLTYYLRYGLLNFSTNFFYWFSAILTYALPGLLLFLVNPDPQPEDVASVVAVSAVNYYLMSTLVYSIYVSESYTKCMAHSVRVAETLKYTESIFLRANRSYGSSKYETSDHVEAVDVKIMTPLQEVLLNSLTFCCSPTDSLVIKGPSGTGKSSILRVLCGIWPPAHGTIKCIDKQTFFMPQKPYLTEGTLREQFTYPNVNVLLSDEDLKELLDKVDMTYVLERFNPDSKQTWSNVLSGGEQQRVGMARLLYAKPAFAVLDEATSAVDEKLEEKFYSQLRLMGVVMVSVAHRPAVAKYHDCILHLDGKKGYTFTRNDAVRRSNL